MKIYYKDKEGKVSLITESDIHEILDMPMNEFAAIADQHNSAVEAANALTNEGSFLWEDELEDN